MSRPKPPPPGPLPVEPPTPDEYRAGVSRYWRSTVLRMVRNTQRWLEANATAWQEDERKALADAALARCAELREDLVAEDHLPDARIALGWQVLQQIVREIEAIGPRIASARTRLGEPVEHRQRVEAARKRVAELVAKGEPKADAYKKATDEMNNRRTAEGLTEISVRTLRRWLSE